MEEPTFTAIDYNHYENMVIEGLVRDNYSKIKNTFYKVFNKRVKNSNSPVGLCADLIEASNYNDDLDRIWMEELEMYYLFFYEIRNGRRVLGKDRVKKILDILL